VTDSSVVKAVLFGMLLFLILVIPFLFLFLISRFKNGQSTAVQRGWMMAWICANQVSFFPFAYISTYDPAFLLSQKNRLFLYVVMSPLGAASLGGFIEVGTMMKDFGSCSLAPS